MAYYRIRWILRLCLFRGSDSLIQFSDFFQILADSFLGGNTALAGVIIMLVVLCAIMAFSKKLITTLLLAVPVIMMFAWMNLIPQEIGLVMLLIVALAIAFESRGVFD